LSILEIFSSIFSSSYLSLAPAHLTYFYFILPIPS